MTIKELIQKIQQEFTTLKDKITTKLAHKDELIQAEKDSKQETIRQLETTLKENSENEKVLETLLKDFQELTQQLEES